MTSFLLILSLATHQSMPLSSIELLTPSRTLLAGVNSELFVLPEQDVAEWKAKLQSTHREMTYREYQDFQKRLNSSLETSPRIAVDHAEYTAEYVDSALVGTAKLTINNSKQSTFILPQNNLAWKNPKSDDGQSGQMSTRMGSHLAKDSVAMPQLIEVRFPRATKSCTLEWSRRSSSLRKDRIFELHFPESHATMLSIAVPSNLVVRPQSDSIILETPQALDNQRNRWTMKCRGGVKNLISIGSADAGTSVMAVVNTIQVHHQLDRITTTHRFEWTHGDRRSTFVFSIPAGAQVVAVRGDRLKTFSKSKPDELSVLVMPSHEAGAMEIDLVYSQSGRREMTPSRVVLRQAVIQQESFIVRHSEKIGCSLVSLGDFQIESSTREDQQTTWTLNARLLEVPNQQFRRLPTVEFWDRSRAVSLNGVQIFERSQFHIESAEATLNLRMTMLAESQSIERIAIIEPDQYHRSEDDLDFIEPRGSIIESANNQKIIQFDRPVKVGERVTWNVRYRKAIPDVSTIQIPIPAITWIGANRSGNVSVTASRAFEPLGPLVVAYQDFPPSSMIVLKKAMPIEAMIPNAPSDRVNTHREFFLQRSCVIDDGPWTMVHSGFSPSEWTLELPAQSRLTKLSVDSRLVERHDTIGDSQIIVPAGAFLVVTEWLPSSRWFFWRKIDNRNDEVSIQHANRWKVFTIHNRILVIHERLLDGFLAILFIAAVGLKMKRYPKMAMVALSVFIVLGLLRSPIVVLMLLLVISVIMTFLKARTRKAVIALVTLFVILTGPIGHSQSIDDFKIYLFQDDESKTTKALVPIKLIEFADRLSEEKTANIESADYQGILQETYVEWQSTWTVNVIDQRPIKIPLTNATIVQVSLDEKPTFPVALPNGGFMIRDLTPGRYSVKAKLQTPITSLGFERSSRFTGPECPAVLMSFQSAAFAKTAFSEFRLGRQKLNAAGDTVTIDQGHNPNLAIRWRTNDRPAPISEASREFSVVRFERDRTTMTTAIQFPTVYQYDPKFEIELPSNFDVIRVMGYKSEGLPIDCEVNRLPESNTAIVSFPSIVEGRVSAILTLLPKHGPSATLRLNMPRLKTKSDPQAITIMTFDGVTPKAIGRSNLLDLPIDSAYRSALLWPAFTIDKNRNWQAFRCNGELPEFRLEIAHRESWKPPSYTQSWQVGRGNEATGELTLDSAKADSIRMKIPPGMTMHTVRGRSVIDAVVIDDELKISLRENDEPCSIRWYGIYHDRERDRTLPTVPLIRNGMIILPSVTTVAMPGWTVKPEITSAVKGTRVTVSPLP